MNRTVTPEDKEIFMDIYEDLAKQLGWELCYVNRQTARESFPFPLPIFLNVEHFGKDHPKFPLISKFFSEPETKPVDCHNRRDWWSAIVHMLDDSKQFLSEKDRKELYLDLSSLIDHRLNRKEY